MRVVYIARGYLRLCHFIVGTAFNVGQGLGREQLFYPGQVHVIPVGFLAFAVSTKE